MTTPPYPLQMENCITLRPTMEQFKDELAFLASDDVQNAGKRCGIVRVVTPPEFQPTRVIYSEADCDEDSPSWTEELPVLQQQFLPLRLGRRAQAGMYILGRRYESSRILPTAEWRKLAEKWKGLTEDAMKKKLGRKNPNYQLDPDARRHYWDSRPYQHSAFYGADVSQSAIKLEQECWNFSSDKFPCMTQMFRTKRTPGVYTPYLYVGSWGTSFGLHPEDKDLYSLNFLHEGSSKFWYGFPASSSAEVEKFAAELLPDEARECDQFLRHKTLLIEPRYFLERHIPVFAAEQKQGDLMITFPNAYHYGFNSGFNLAEARNIATPDWLEFGLKAKQCTCDTYKAPDVLPWKRIFLMAKKCQPLKYANMKTLNSEDEEKSVDHQAKKMRKGL